MKKIVMVDEMTTPGRAKLVADALKAIDGVSKVVPSVEKRALLVEAAPYVNEADLMAAAFGAGFNAEVAVDYSLEKAIADAASRIENHQIKL